MSNDQVDFIPIRQGEVNIQKSINMTQYINRLKGGKKTGSSCCRKKPFDKNLTNVAFDKIHYFMLKMQQIRYRRNITQHNKGHA